MTVSYIYGINTLIAFEIGVFFVDENFARTDENFVFELLRR